MRLTFLVLFLLLLHGAPLRADNEPASSALGAMKLLPRGEAKRLARIEARDGTPVPERWHFIVHDPKSSTGVHEYVIASSEIVASREISQFVENLRPDDVFGGDALKINSDRVAKLAQQYAHANNLVVTTMNYELKKQGAAAAALWTVTCLDENGQELGRLVVSAGKGNVISHPGFTAEPPPPVAPVATPTLAEKMKQPTEAVLTPKATPMPVMVAEPVNTPPPATPVPKKPGLFDRMGNSIQKVFTGKERKPPE
jgi:hypothetical protein